MAIEGLDLFKVIDIPSRLLTSLEKQLPKSKWLRTKQLHIVDT